MASLPDLASKELQTREFHTMLRTTLEQMEDKPLAKKLVNLVKHYQDVFLSEYSPEPSSLHPMRVQLK